MIEFKKRLRVLAGDSGYETEYLNDGGMRFSKDDAVLQFNPKSKHFVACSVVDNNECFRFDARKELVFDVFLRFSDSGSRASLKNYRPGQLLTIQDYIEEEDGRKAIDDLRSRLKVGPVARQRLGGNRIFVEYLAGILVITDDLMTASSNVVELA